MELLIVFVILLLNLGISYWNAYAVGKSWVESKHAGGWVRFMVWMGALMSALGFTWCYLIIVTFVLGAMNILGLKEMEVALNLGYLLVIPGFLFSGLMITIDSWARAYRERSWTNVGVAGYNTFAQMYNSYNAISGIGESLGNVGDFFKDLKGDDEDSTKAFIIIIVVLFALFAGVLTTAVIIQHFAGSDEPVRANR